MNNSLVIFEHSPWFIVLCLLAGAFYSFLLYRKPGPWSARVKYIMASLRGLAVAVLCFLLLGPIIKQIVTETEKPGLVIAIDNSLSVAEGEDSLELTRLNARIESLKANVDDIYNVEVRTLGGPGPEDATALEYDYSTTDLGQLLRNIESDYEGRNLSRVVLATDGIFNQGLSPAFRDYPYTIHTIGLGDTVAREDLAIRAVYYNKIAYQGNTFPVVVEVINEGFTGRIASVSISRGNQVIATRQIQFERNNELNEIEFLIDAAEEGIQRYQVNLSYLEGELLRANNNRRIFVDVVEGRESILIVAPYPHPDIKALRSAIESNENYQVTQYINGIDTYKDELYDLVIFHQVPDRRGRLRQLHDQIREKNSSFLYVTGSGTNLGQLFAGTNLINITSRGYQSDQVTAAYNPGFNDFLISDDLKAIFPEFPPVTVPFGRYTLDPGLSVLLNQQVGSVETTRPLIALGAEDGKKIGFILGEGLWRWKLHDYRETEDFRHFNELISKLTQYLSAKEDKRKFRVYTTEEQYTSSEPVRFVTEIYNDLYEPDYGHNIDLTITDGEGESNQYSYTNSPSRSSYNVSGLSEGVYQFTASTLLNGQLERSSGEFVVEKLNIEMLNLTADHNLLRQLATRTGGRYFSLEDMGEIDENLRDQQGTTILRSYENYSSVINLKWLFFILLGLIAAEWFLRKYSGSY